VWTPPSYSRDTCNDSRGCVVLPDIEAIRNSVANAFRVDPEQEQRREALAAEGAQVLVLNPLSDRDAGTRLAGYLEVQGLQASSPRAKPEGGVPADTKIVVYNGAQSGLAQTIAYLEERFKVTVELADDPAMRADVVITIGRATPDLRPPPSS
jgi:hypothetical protein